MGRGLSLPKLAQVASLPKPAQVAEVRVQRHKQYDEGDHQSNYQNRITLP
jgi:hypothetical protein